MKADQKPVAFSSWSSPEELEAFLVSRGSAWIFKHSTQCSISAAANAEIKSLETKLPVFRILVIENRPTSNAIAEKLDVKHASPQAILLRAGKAAWSATHWDITAEALARAESEAG